MKKKQFVKTILFGSIFTALIVSSILPAKVVAVTPTDIFDAAFDTQVQALMAIPHVESLALSIINGTEVFYETGYGEQPGTDIVYWLNAIGCIVGATALLQLKDDGLFSLNDPINDYLPWILRNPYYPDTNITIYDVLAEQTTLLYTEEQDQALVIDKVPFPDFLYETLNENGSYYTIDAWRNREPGTAYEHHYLNWDLAPYLVELISGEPYEQYVEKNIFTPLGMTNTEFTYTNYTLNQLAKQYIWNKTSGVNEEQPFWDDVSLSLNILSTVGDVSKFLIAHMNEGVYNSIRILETATVRLMHKTVADEFGLFWGNGFLESNSYHGFRSWPCIGAGCMLTKENLGVIVFVNQGHLGYLYDFPGILELHQQLGDIFEYIASIAEELIPTPITEPTPTETRLELIAIPIFLAIIGAVVVYKKKIQNRKVN